MERTERQDLTVVGLVGTGVMGRGIAQIVAQAGMRVLLFDTLPGVAAKARTAIGETLSRLVERGRLDSAAAS